MSSVSVEPVMARVKRRPAGLRALDLLESSPLPSPGSNLVSGGDNRRAVLPVMVLAQEHRARGGNQLYLR
jgi:hypothetical protein